MISAAAESLSWPFSLFFNTCRSFFVRCLQSFPGRYPAQGSCRGSCPDSPATLRYHTAPSSAGLLLCILSCISPLPSFNFLPTFRSLLFSRLPLFVLQHRCDGGDGGSNSSSSSSSSSWWRRIPELRNSNEISGKVNILCVNQIPTNIRERVRIRGMVRLNSIATPFHGCTALPYLLLLFFIGWFGIVFLLFSSFRLLSHSISRIKSLVSTRDIPSSSEYQSTIEFLSRVYRALQRRARYRGYLHR